MKILIAPDSFKGCLTALEVAENIEKGIKNVMKDAEVYNIPMADGGEGTVQSLVDATNGYFIYKEVTGPLGEPVEAHFGILGNNKTAVIEMAIASGFDLVPKDKANPCVTTTYGTGELIKAALDENIEEIIIGIGGSSTNDGGVGMAQSLGVNFLDKEGNNVGFGGRSLKYIDSIDMSGLDPRVKKVDIRVACDVTNPLYGTDGAAYVYAPQKGATMEMVKQLDNNLRHLSDIVKKELGKDIQSISGGGAAGGLGAGLVAFLDAKLQSGVDIIIEVNKLEREIKNVDLVITGEGKIDSQTVKGKTPIGVAKVAKKYNKPVIAICGSIGDNFELVLEKGIDAVFSIMKEPSTLEKTIKRTPSLLEMTGEHVIRVLLLNIINNS